MWPKSPAYETNSSWAQLPMGSSGQGVVFGGSSLLLIQARSPTLHTHSRRRNESMHLLWPFQDFEVFVGAERIYIGFY